MSHGRGNFTVWILVHFIKAMDLVGRRTGHFSLANNVTVSCKSGRAR